MALYRATDGENGRKTFNDVYSFVHLVYIARKERKEMLKINGNTSMRVGDFAVWHVVDENNNIVASVFGPGSLSIALFACERVEMSEKLQSDPYSGWTQRAIENEMPESAGKPNFPKGYNSLL